MECFETTQPEKRTRINVLVSSISAERFWETNRPLPAVKIATNLNLINVDKSRNDWLEIPFVFTISYNPAVAQISFKGKAHVIGKKDELENIYDTYGKKKVPPPIILQTISNVVFLESVLISRTLNIPPPIPLPKVPPVKRKSDAEPSYRA